jgi:O-antigen biosynthesis protein
VTFDRAIRELLPDSGRVLAVSGTDERLVLDGDYSVTYVDASGLGSLDDEPFDAAVLEDVLDRVDDPAAVLLRVRELLAEGGGVVTTLKNGAHGSVRLALLAGRLEGPQLGPPDGRLRLFTRETIADLFEQAGYLITHWGRERSEIEGAMLLADQEIREVLTRDPESTTSTFRVRAQPSDAAGQLAEARAKLRASQQELEALRESHEDATGLGEEIEAFRSELETLRRAHEERGRRLVAERLEFANELAALQQYIHAIHQSRSFRYTAVFRRLFGAFRGRG